MKISKIQIKLKSTNEDNINYNMSSLFHGALMELIEPAYAEELHQENIRPYSQSIDIKENEIIWIVNTLNEQAKENIIDVLNDEKIKSIILKKKDITLDILGKKVKEYSYEELINDKYFGNTGRIQTVRFVTPTAFKSKGQYVFYPNVRNIYNSLMKKYDANCDKISIYDEEALDELEKNSNIIRYNLKSINFHLEGIKIPAFIGEITLKISGQQQLVNLANLLLYYGEYAGVGIKSAIGMGAMSVLERKFEKKPQKNNIEEKLKSVINLNSLK